MGLRYPRMGSHLCYPCIGPHVPACARMGPHAPACTSMPRSPPHACASPITGFVENAAHSFEIHLQQMVAPLLALAALVHADPDYQTLAGNFPAFAKDLLEVGVNFTGTPNCVVPRLPKPSAVQKQTDLRNGCVITNLRLAPHDIVPTIWLPGRHTRINPASPAHTRTHTHARTRSHRCRRRM